MLKNQLLSLASLFFLTTLYFTVHAQSIDGKILELVSLEGENAYQYLEQATIYVGNEQAISNRDGRFQIALEANQDVDEVRIEAQLQGYSLIDHPFNPNFQIDSSTMVNLVMIKNELYQDLLDSCYQVAKAIIRNYNIDQSSIHAETAHSAADLQRLKKLYQDLSLPKTENWLDYFILGQDDVFNEAFLFYMKGNPGEAIQTLGRVIAPALDNNSFDTDLDASFYANYAFYNWLIRLDQSETGSATADINAGLEELAKSSPFLEAKLNLEQVLSHMLYGDLTLMELFAKLDHTTQYLAEIEQPEQLKVSYLYEDIAKVYQYLGDHELAIVQLDEAINIFETLLPTDHRKFGAVYRDMAILQAKVLEPERAFFFLEKAIAVQEQLPLAYRGDLAETYRVYGSLYTNIDTKERGRIYLKKSLDIHRESSSTDANALFQLNKLLGYNLEETGDYARALNHYELALKFADQIQDLEAAELAMANSNVARLYALNGMVSSAIPFQVKAVEIFETFLHEEHPALVVYYKNVANAMEQMGRFSESILYLEKALVIEQKIMPATDQQIATTHYNLSKLYFAEGNRSKSDYYMELAMAYLNNGDGKGNQQTLPYRNTVSDRRATNPTSGSIAIFKDRGAETFTEKGVAPKQIILPILEEGRYAVAEASAMEFLGQDPDNQEWRVWLTIALTLQGKTEKAHQIWYLFNKKMINDTESFQDMLLRELHAIKDQMPLTRTITNFIERIENP